MSLSSFFHRQADAPFFRHFPRYAGAAVASFGLLIVISWHAHWQSILQMLPDTAPMQYNTALCFILSGTGLLLLTTAHAKIAPWLGGAVAVFTLLTLLEYLTDWDLHIDQFFFRSYLNVAVTYLGRMSPLAAVCFLLTGTGIVLVEIRKQWRYRLAVTGIFASMVGSIALVALLGFIFGVEAATGWGAYSRIAINTSVAFLVLSLGLLIWLWQAARRENLNFLRLLPVTASVTLMTMIAFVSAVNLLELKKATFWRKHTVQVILNAQLFEENLIDLQRGMRGYVTLGDTNALAAYRQSLSLEPLQFNQLAELTSDNPVQWRRLKDLSVAMSDMVFYDERTIALYKEQGFAGVSKTETNGESRKVFGNARDNIKAFSQEEQSLLATRDALEQKDSNDVESLLIFGSVFAVMLLVAATTMTAHEIDKRRRFQTEREKIIEELQLALADVKTLSGLIPMCGWCKSVRTDKGFWQTVEHYVGAHSDATFSHGICPKCEEKFRADIVKANAR
jgi:CHASE3 domain sensor protein